MTPKELHEWKDRAGCSWATMARALGYSQPHMRAMARGQYPVGNPTTLRLALERLEETGELVDPVSDREIRRALAESSALARLGAASPRLEAARAALQGWHDAGREGRNHKKARAAIAEHAAALTEARKPE